MFGIGIGELIVICVVALLFFGPNKLPEVMRQAGKLYVYLRRQSNDFKGAFEKIVREAEEDLLKEEREKIKRLIESASTIEAPRKPDPSADHPLDTPADPHSVTPTIATTTNNETAKNSEIGHGPAAYEEPRPGEKKPSGFDTP